MKQLHCGQITLEDYGDGRLIIVVENRVGCGTYKTAHKTGDTTIEFTREQTDAIKKFLNDDHEYVLRQPWWVRQNAEVQQSPTATQPPVLKRDVTSGHTL